MYEDQRNIADKGNGPKEKADVAVHGADLDLSCTLESRRGLITQTLPLDLYPMPKLSVVCVEIDLCVRSESHQQNE